MQPDMNFRSLFPQVFEANGLSRFITDGIMDKFEHLTRLMLETNAVMNVTALTTLDKIIPLHYADCALIADCIPTGATLLDVGCGGGFPCLPLAILRPDLRITALDSTEKKIRYVEAAAKALELPLKTVAARAEELAAHPAYRESFDVVTSRAVARLNLLDELCLPFVRVGGLMVTMKGAAGQTELMEARRGIGRLGGSRVVLTPGRLITTDGEEARTTILITKTAPTPAAYPRQFAKIKKSPL